MPLPSLSEAGKGVKMAVKVGKRPENDPGNDILAIIKRRPKILGFAWFSAPIPTARVPSLSDAGKGFTLAAANPVTARVRFKAPGVGNVKRRPPSDSAGRAERGDRCFPADGPSVLSLRATAILAFSNDRCAITRERKGVEQSYSHDCVQLAETYAA